MAAVRRCRCGPDRGAVHRERRRGAARRGCADPRCALRRSVLDKTCVDRRRARIAGAGAGIGALIAGAAGVIAARFTGARRIGARLLIADARLAALVTAAGIVTTGFAGARLIGGAGFAAALLGRARLVAAAGFLAARFFARGGGGFLRYGFGGLFHAAGRFGGGAGGLCGAIGVFLGRALIIFFAAAGFFGRGKNLDLFGFAAFGFTLLGGDLLFLQHALAHGELTRGQRAATATGTGLLLRPGRRGYLRHRTRFALRGRRRRGYGDRRNRLGPVARALFAHLHLHDFGSAMTEALPHRPRVNGAPKLQPSRRSQREPLLVRVLVIAVGHSFAHSISSVRPEIPASRFVSTSSKSANRPAATATCTV